HTPPPPPPHSFPTRRSSDLPAARCGGIAVEQESERPVARIRFLRVLGDFKLLRIFSSRVNAFSDLGPWCRPVDIGQRLIEEQPGDRKSTRLNSSHLVISYAV